MADVLVAGGAGFIGAHLVKRLLDRGDKVTVVSLKESSPQIERWHKSVQFLPIDLRQSSDVQSALKGRSFELVFNLSGYIDHTPFSKGGRAVLDQHFLAVQNLVEYLDRTRLRAYMQAGSSDEYGNAASPVSETAREAPIAPYSAGKAAATHFIQMLHRNEGFPGTIVRFFLVYGPHQGDKRFIPQIVKGCLEKKTFPASEGKQLRDFCYVDDIVEGVLLAAETPAAQGHVFNLASGKAVSIRSVVEKIVEISGGGQPNYGAVPYRPGESMALYADISKARAMLNWSPKTDLSSGLKLTIDSYRKPAPAAK